MNSESKSKKRKKPEKEEKKLHSINPLTGEIEEKTRLPYRKRNRTIRDVASSLSFGLIPSSQQISDEENKRYLASRPPKKRTKKIKIGSKLKNTEENKRKKRIVGEDNKSTIDILSRNTIENNPFNITLHGRTAAIKREFPTEFEQNLIFADPYDLEGEDVVRPWLVRDENKLFSNELEDAKQPAGPLNIRTPHSLDPFDLPPRTESKQPLVRNSRVKVRSHREIEENNMERLRRRKRQNDKDYERRLSQWQKTPLPENGQLHIHGTEDLASNVSDLREFGATYNEIVHQQNTGQKPYGTNNLWQSQFYPRRFVTGPETPGDQLSHLMLSRRIHDGMNDADFKQGIQRRERKRIKRKKDKRNPAILVPQLFNLDWGIDDEVPPGKKTSIYYK